MSVTINHVLSYSYIQSILLPSFHSTINSTRWNNDFVIQRNVKYYIGKPNRFSYRNDRFVLRKTKAF